MMEQREKVFNDLALEIADLLFMKNNGYGDSFTKYNTIELSKIIDQKMVRVRNLESGLLSDTEESVLDAFRDVAGYCILAEIIIRRDEYEEIFNWDNTENCTQCDTWRDFYPYCPYCGRSLQE